MPSGRNWDTRCHFCGSPTVVGNLEGKTWNNTIRALYFHGTRLDSPYLSGIGLRTKAGGLTPASRMAVYVPVDPKNRFSSPVCDSQDNFIKITDTIPTFPEKIREALEAAEDVGWADDVVWGFIFHNACWNLLKYACLPRRVNLLALARLLITHVRGPGMIDWMPQAYKFAMGHGRGWERNTGLPFKLLLGKSWGTDPVNIGPVVVTLHNHIRERVRKSIKSSYRHPSRTENDCFSALPYEIRELILCNLKSDDIPNLLIASRVFRAMRLSQTFWASRFHRGNENYVYHYNILAANFNREKYYLDFERLYYFLAHKRPWSTEVANRLQNRERILGLACPLVYLLDHVTAAKPLGKPIQSPLEPTAPKEVLALGEGKVVSALTRLVASPSSIQIYCRPLFRRSATIEPGQVSEVDIILLPFYRHAYVTGLRFRQKDGETVTLGYSHSNSISLPYKLSHNEAGKWQSSCRKLSEEKMGVKNHHKFHLKILWGFRATAARSKYEFGETNDLRMIDLAELVPDPNVVRKIEIVADFDGLRMICLEVKSRLWWGQQGTGQFHSDLESLIPRRISLKIPKRSIQWALTVESLPPEGNRAGRSFEDEVEKQVFHIEEADPAKPIAEVPPHAANAKMTLVSGRMRWLQKLWRRWNGP